jgi:hypothetical protein
MGAEANITIGVVVVKIKMTGIVRTQAWSLVAVMMHHIYGVGTSSAARIQATIPVKCSVSSNSDV